MGVDGFASSFRAIIIAIVCVQQVLGVPTFKKIACGKNKGYDLCLEVDYEDKKDDVLLLNKVTKGTVGVQNEDTVFEGRLLREGRRVAVTIEDATKPDDIEVVLFSKHSPKGSLFKADLKKNTAELIKIPEKDKNGLKYVDSPLEIPSALATNSSGGRTNLGVTSAAAIPSVGFKLPVHVYYDDSFNTRFGSGVNTRINALFTIVKTIYSDPSLGTVLDPEVVEITYMSGQTWTATSGNLRTVSQNIASPATSNAYAYVFLCSENDQGGVVGIAWLKGTCHSNRYVRSSINEYLRNDAVTGAIIAHEIGHNLGMYHDFGATTSTNKYSSTGVLCTGVGGYMDYRSNPNKWSACSVEDYTTYYNSVSPWCLTPLTATTTTAPTTVAPTTVASTTAAPTTAAPTTAAPTTAAPTTAAPTTVAPPTAAPTTAAPTVAPTTPSGNTTVAPPTTPGVDCFQWNRVSFGRNMRPAPFNRNVENVFECQRLCQAETQCKYFAYDTRRGRKWCWLKTGIYRLRRASGIMFGTKNCTGCTPVTQDRFTFCSTLGDFLITGCRSNWWLRRNCGKSCEICRPTSSGGNTCRDQTRRCTRWKTRCKNPYVQRRCKKTCGLCNSSTCKDQLRGSNCQKLKGRCTTSTYTKTYCKKTCGLCTSSNGNGNCKDKLRGNRCRRLRRRCRRSRYVQKNCKKTCGRC